MSDDTGSVVTVDGRIDPTEMGVTLPHEHTFVDMVEAWFHPPESAVDRRLAREPVALDNLWYVRRHPQQHEDNMRIDDVDETVEEVTRAKRAGVETIVDVTPKCMGGDPERVRAVARETGLHYVHGTAYYTRAAHPSGIDDRDQAEIAAEFVDDVQNGIDGTDVRAGIIGEIGLSERIHEQEEKVLRAAATAALETGAQLTVHPPGRSPNAQQGRTYPTSRWGGDVLDIVGEIGLPPERVVICHMDRTLFEDIEYQKELADRGAFIEYDLWGTEFYHEEYDDGYLSDAQRIDAVQELIDAGCGSNLLFSHDLCMKIQRTKYGGFGYAHLLENVIGMLEGRGIDRGVIDGILVDNPREMLTFAEPA